MGMVIIVGIVGLFAVIIITVVVAEKNKIVGFCPNCKSRIRLSKGIGACGNCGQAMVMTNGAYAPPAKGFLPDNTQFIMSMGKLKPPTEWATIWPGRCCVCGAATDKPTTIKIKVIRGHAGPILAPSNLTDTVKYEIGYCPAHSDGMRYSFPPGVANAKYNDQCLLAIRSYDYYRDFMRENGNMESGLLKPLE